MLFMRHANGSFFGIGYGTRGLAGPGLANTLTTLHHLPTLEGATELAFSEHTCFIKGDGTLWCMGRNDFGQCSGDIVSPASLRQVTVPNDPTATFIDVCAGQYHSCAITDSYELYCWGQNTYYQTGQSSTANQPTPEKVDGVDDARRVTCNQYGTLVSMSDHSVRGFGRNNFRQLGAGMDVSTGNQLSLVNMLPEMCFTVTPSPTASPTQAPTGAPTSSPTHSPTFTGYCAATSDEICDQATEICDVTNYCVAKPACEDHVDCNAHLLPGRLAFCNASVCEDLRAGSCSTNLACDAKLNIDRKAKAGMGSAKMTFASANATQTSAVIKSALSKIRTNFTGNAKVVPLVAGNESAAVPSTLYDSDPDFLEKFKAARCGNATELCEATVTFGGGRRLSARSLATENVTIEITYQLDADAYDEISDFNFDDPVFLDSLAEKLGVAAEDIDVTGGESSITIEVVLTEESDGTTPIGADTLAAIQGIQDNLGDITDELVEELDIDASDIQSEELDLCADRDCSGRGVCDAETGVCACNDPAFWGINCETSVSCENGGTPYGAYCQCNFPSYGLRCELSRDCACA